MSLHRRYTIVPKLDVNVKETIEKAPIGQMLFGEDLGTRCKNAKDVKRSGNEIKRKQTSFNKNSLNFRRLPAQIGRRATWKANYQNNSTSATQPIKRQQYTNNRGAKERRG